MAQDTVSRPMIRLHDPVANEGSHQETLAQRGGDLSGKVVALLDNTKPLVDTLLDEVKSLIERDFPGARFRYFKKPSVSGAHAELIEQLAACDVVVTAVGD